MRLTVLGGSAASPNTGAGCSGYLLQSASASVWIDPGPGTLPELRKHVDFRRLDAVLVTHMHLDHVLDLLALRHALAYNPISAPGPVPVWLPPGGADFLARVVAPFDECDRPGRFNETLHVYEYEPADELRLAEGTVRVFWTIHYLPSWAVRITEPSGQSFGFTGDTGPAAGLADFFSGINLLLAEATLLEALGDGNELRGSLTALEAGELARNASAVALMLTHLWEERGFDAAVSQARQAFD